MVKCLLWGMGRYFNEYVNLVKYHEMMKRFEIVGVTSDTSIYSEIRGYKYISKSQLDEIDFDIIIIMANGSALKSIYEEIRSKAISEDCVFTYKILTYDNFDINKIMPLKKDTPSIFCHNCWAGITYSRLGLQFKSPFINMFETVSDYLKILEKPQQYLNEKLEFVKTSYDRNINNYYPTVKCGDVLLQFNHYDSFESAKECWERRKQRINWDNLFVMMFTEDPVKAEQFLKLPYQKKVCFVPFESDEKQLAYVDFRNRGEMAEVPFWKIVNGMATGLYPYYDVIDLLSEGKVTKIIKT